MADFILFTDTGNSDFAKIDTMSIEALNYITEETDMNFERGGLLSIRTEAIKSFCNDAENAHLHVEDNQTLGIVR